MRWFLVFFFCNTWGEFFIAAVVGAMGLIVFWGLLVLTFVLFG